MEGLEIAVTSPGATQTHDDLARIVDAFEAIEDQTNKVTRAQEGLHTAIGSGTTSASKFKDALANVKATGLEELSQKASELGQNLGGVAGQVASIAIKSAASFGPVGVALTAVGAALAFGVQAYREHEAAVALDNTRTEELTRSTQALGETYPSLATAVNTATTATEAHTRAVAENQRLLSQQLQLMNAQFSAEEAQRYTLQLQQTAGAVRELGTYLHGATEEMVRQTIESGNTAAQQTLLGFSFTHSSDAVQEHTNRVNAGIVVAHQAAAAIAEHKQQLVDQARAALESANAELQDAATMEDNGAARTAALRRIRQATDALAEAQRNALVAQQNASRGNLEAVAALDALESSTRAAEEAQHDAALRRGYAALTRIAHEQEQRRRASHTAATEDDKTQKTEQMARDQEERARQAAQMRADRDLNAERVRQARDYDNALHAASEAWGEQVTHANEVMRITARITSLEGEATSASEVRLRRAQASQQRGEGRVAARAEIEDIRDPISRRARIEEMAQQHQLQRERAHLNQRYELQRTWTDRMEELHGQEVNSTQALAEGTSAAFSGMAEAFGHHLQAFVTGKETIGEALQGMLSDTLASIAQQATVKGALELAEGIAALAGVVTAGLAPGHFAASAAYFGVAALAGIGAAATAPTPATPAAAPARASSSTSTEPATRLPSGGGKGSGEKGEGTTVNISFGGPMYGTGGVRQAARQIAGALNRGAVQGNIQLLPGVLQGNGAGS